MKYLKLFENFSEKYPKSITIELTDKFVKENNIYKRSGEIKMQPEIYYNLGNTTANAFEDVTIYFGIYKPEIGEVFITEYVIPARKKGETEWFLYLSKEKQLYPNQVKNIESYVDKGELKHIPGTNCIFREDDYYKTKGFVEGSEDHRGYLRIVKID